MGVMGRILGIGGAAATVGEAVTGVAEVFVGNRANREAAEADAFSAVVEAAGAEYAQPPATGFDGWVNGLNRLPRPLLALSTIGLFGYAMAEPIGFGVRMQGLALVPDQLWWLLGAIVSFYFGARELHYLRDRAPTRPPRGAPSGGEGAAAPLFSAASAAVAAGSGNGVTAPGAVAAAPAPRPRPAQFKAAGRPAAPAAARAADPGWNAVLEEWRAGKG